MKSLVRWRLVVLTLLVFLLVVGVRYYLSSRQAANQVATKLQGLLGVDVHVGEVAIGLEGDSSLKDVKIFEASGPDGAAPPTIPFVAFESIKADISALDLLGDKAAPQDLTLTGPSVVLRFDRAGTLLTRLPTSSTGGVNNRLPRIVMVNGSVTFQQEGREPFHIRGLSGELTASEIGFRVDGRISDPDLGQWDVHATYQTEKGIVALSLKAPDLSVPGALLKRVPFLPPKIQELLACEGHAAVECQVTVHTDGKPATYHATVEAHGLRLRMLKPGQKKPSFELPEVSGSLTIASTPAGPTINADLTDRDWGRWIMDATWSVADEQIKIGLLTPEGAPFHVSAQRLQALPLDDDIRKNIAATTDVEGAVGVNLKATLSTVSRKRVTFQAQLEPKDIRFHLKNVEPPLLLDHLGGKVMLEGSEFGATLTGDLTDTTWGRWLIGGSYDEMKEVFTLNLHTPPGRRIEVTRALLRKVPEVPASVWDEVQIDAGDTTVAFALTIPLTGPVHYALDLDPRNTRLHVSSIGLDADKVQGRVLVNDKVIQLRKVQGMAAQGDVNVEAELDFRQPWFLPPTSKRSVLTFDIKASKLRIRDLPASWHLPTLLGGNLTGQARLAVLMDGETPPRTVGQGGGTIDLGAQQGEIKLALHADAQRGIQIAPISEQSMANRSDPAPPALFDPNLPIPPVPRAEIPLSRPDPETDKSDPAMSFMLMPARWSVRTVNAIADAAVGITDYLHRVRNPLAPGQKPTTYDLELQFDNVSLGGLLRRLKIAVPLEGRLTARFKASIPTDAPGDLKWYTITGSAELPYLTVGGVNLVGTLVSVRLDNGVLELNALHAWVLPPGPASSNALRALAGGAGVLTGTWGTIDGKARVQIVPELGRLTAELRGDHLPLSLPLVPGQPSTPAECSGQFTIVADARTFADMRAWDVTGTMKAGRLTATGFDLSELQATIEIDKGKITIRDLEGRISEGTLTGQAEIGLVFPFAVTGKLRFQGADLAELSQLAGAARQYLPLGGRCNLGVDVKGTLWPFATQVDLTANRLRVLNIRAQRLVGRLIYGAGKGTYHLEGEASGGRFNWDGAFPAPPARMMTIPGLAMQVGPRSAPDGTFRLDGARLAGLVDLFPDNVDLVKQIAGSLDLALEYRTGPDGVPVGKGNCWLGNVRYEDSLIASGLQAEVRLGARGLEIREINGDIAGGALRGRIVINMARADRGYFDLTVEQAEASKLLLPFFSTNRSTGRVETVTMTAPIEGPITVNLRGTLGSEWRGNGTVVLTRGRVLGLEVVEWRLPFEIGLVPGEGRGEVRVSDSVLQAARGRGVGRAELTWSVSGVRLDGTLRFFDTELRGLLRPLGAASSIAVGRLTGRLDFGSNALRSLDDLTASLDASLDGSQALQLPVLSLLAPYVAPGNAALTFDHGQVSARLAHGVIRINRLALTSTLVQLMIDGTVSMSGALDLEVSAQTGRLGLSPSMLSGLAGQAPASGPVPRSLLAQATDLLSSRLAHLRITGNMRSPSVRFEPLHLLTDDTFRFFVGLAPANQAPASAGR